MAKSLNINISNLIFNGDATEVIALVPATNVTNRLTQLIVDGCRVIFQAFQEVKLQHCYILTGKLIGLLTPLAICSQNIQFTPPKGNSLLLSFQHSY